MGECGDGSCGGREYGSHGEERMKLWGMEVVGEGRMKVVGENESYGGRRKVVEGDRVVGSWNPTV